MKAARQHGSPCGQPLKYKDAYEGVHALMGMMNSSTFTWAVDWTDMLEWSLNPLPWLGSLLQRKPTITQARTLQQPGAAPLKALLQCANEVYQPVALTWELATSDTITAMKVAAAWWDTRNPVIGLTLVTSGSIERLQQIKAMCLSWRGPLVAVVYLPLLQPGYRGRLNEANKAILRRSVLQVSQLVTKLALTSLNKCQLSLMLVYEVFAEEAAQVLYPFNMLRNMARLMARTRLMAQLDADLLPSRSLFVRFSYKNRTMEVYNQAHDNRTVFIIPAIELHKQYDTTLWADALSTAPDKKMVVLGMDHNVTMPFYWTRWQRGHNLTHFDTWKTAEEDYATEYQLKCEPYFVADRKNLPWHDERYRGYGEDKVQHVHNVHNAGFQFKVMHDVYSVHRPHRFGAAQRMYNLNEGVRGKEGLKEFVARLWNRQRHAFEEGWAWAPTIGPTVRQCVEVRKLHWWGATRLPAPWSEPPPAPPPTPEAPLGEANATADADQPADTDVQQAPADFQQTSTGGAQAPTDAQQTSSDGPQTLTGAQ